MGFGENLQFYRKRENITQEQLAEQLGVSRQTISKWESGTSYPEMEKLLQLCEMFHCTMDVLLRGDAQMALKEDTTGYDRHIDQFAKEIAGGIAFILSGVTFAAAAEGFRLPEYVQAGGAILLIVIGVLILIAGGLKHGRFVEKHPQIQPFYTEEELEQASSRFITMTVTGIGIILAGLVFVIVTEGFPVPAGYTGTLYEWTFLLFVTVGVTLLVYGGIKKSKYNIEDYNRENAPGEKRKEDKADRIKSAVCGCIMLVATIIFLVAGLGFNLWEKCWIVYVVGGLLCGIASIVIEAVCR